MELELNQTIESTICSQAPEMRRSQRYKINLHVIISTFVQGISKLIPGYGRNLGEGGMCVFVPAPLKIGDAVEIALQLPGAQAKVALRGRVKSVERFNYSIEFTPIDERARGAILDACRALGGAQ